MKVINAILHIVFIISIPIFLLSLSIGAAVNSRWFYNAGFNRYNISQATGISPSELDKAAAGIISYFNNGDEYFHLLIIKDGQPYQLFSEDEKQIIHLKDVKTWFGVDYKVLLGSFIFILAYVVFMLWRKNRKGVFRGMLWGGSLTIGLMLALGVASLAGFDQLFWNLHLLLFTNDFWLLDPSIDIMIMMLPEGFWFDAVIYIAILTTVLAAVTGISGWFLGRRLNSKN
jgi:integral membrane protein (TIGR01906 family)